MKKLIILIGCVLLNYISFFSQTASYLHKDVSNVTINLDQETVKAQILNYSIKFTAHQDKTYSWYGSMKLMETKGGYDGKLLHGHFSSFYLNNQLKEKGRFRYGLRHREWRYWYTDGKLRELITWKNGVKNGPYELYNDLGQLMARGIFKNDKLHGRFTTYNGNGQAIEKKKYKNGSEVQARVRIKKNKSPDKNSDGVNSKDKPPFLKRLFKKRAKKEETNTEPETQKKSVKT